MSFRISDLVANGIVEASTLKKTGGTSSQFLKADGTVDSSAYVTGGPYLPLSGGTMTGDITMSGNGRGIYFTGGNNRIYFSGYRALEGSTTGSNLQVGEGFSQTQIQSATTQMDGKIYVNSSGTSGSWGYAGLFVDRNNAANNYIPFSFESQYGNHSWGIVARYHIQTGGQDKPSIQFTSTGSNDRWSLGFCSGSDWNFRITQNQGYRTDNSGQDGWGTERFKIDTSGNVYVGGLLQSSSSLRAPIFYDSDNTGYYVDPDSQSNVLRIKTNQTWYDNSGTDWGGGINMSGNSPSIGFQPTSSSWWYMLHHSTNINFYRRNTGGSWNQDGIWDTSGNLLWYNGYMQANTSMRAPIFYDSNDTTYYLDPNSTGTSLKIGGGIVSTAPSGSILMKHEVSEANAWIFRENAANWGLFWLNAGSQSGQTIGSYTTVGAELFGMNNAVTGYNPNSAWSGTDSSTRAAWMLSNYSGYLWTQGTQYSETDMRAPIFYDSANSAYYVDPNSQSRMSTLWLSNGGFSGQLYIGGDSAGGRLNINSDQIWTATGSLYLQYSSSGWVYLNDGGGHTQSATSMRAPIFYDSQDTGYYGDFASTSNMYGANFGDNSSSDQGIGIRYGNYVSGYGRIRFYQAGTNHNTIHSFSSSWQGGTFLAQSAGALNLAGEYGTTFGGWNAPVLAVNADGITFNSATTPSGSTGWNSNSVIRAQRTAGDSVYLEFRNRADQGDYSGLIFTDNNVGGYIAFRTYTGSVNNGSDCLIYGTYQDHVFQVGTTSGVNSRNEVVRIKQSGNTLFGTQADYGFRVSVSGTGYATSDFRAPIFYDSDNTSYYGNFAGTSNLYALTVNQTINGTAENANSLTYYSASPFQWTGSQILYYWTKIANISNVGDAQFTIEISVKNDVNYIPYVLALASISSWNNTTQSIKLDALSSLDREVRIAVDNSGDVWLYAQAEWSSYLRWRVKDKLGSPTIYTSGFTQTTSQPANSTYIICGQNMRGNQGSMSSASVGNSENRVGVLSALGAVYATIYYDRDDTNYYVNPASTSKLVQINLGTTNTSLVADVATGYLKIYGSAGNYLAIGPYNNNGWAYQENVGNGNGTYYYVQAGRHAFNGGDLTPYADSGISLGTSSYRWSNVYTSGWFRNYGAQGMYNESYGNHFYSNSGNSWGITGNGYDIYLQFRSNHQSTMRGYVHANTANEIGFLSEDGNWVLRTWNRGVEAYGSMRAPIFYDSNDTSYYLDPDADLSFRTRGYVGSYRNDVNGIIQSHNTSAAGSPVQLSLRHSYGDVIMQNYRGWIYLYGSAIQTNTSFRAPIFYDSDDTTYYADFANSGRSIYTAGYMQSDRLIMKGSSGGGQIYPTISYGGVSVYGGDSLTNGAWVTVTGLSYGSSPGAGSAEIVVRTAASSKFNVFSYDGSTYTARWAIFGSNGNMTVGNNTDYGYRLYVDGTIYATGNVIAYSDARVKTNIREIENPLDRVLKSRGVIYDRIDTEDKNQVGFIAQELEEQFPELVETSNDGRKGVMYQNMVAVLLEAVKEQQKQIDKLKMLIDGTSK